MAWLRDWSRDDDPAVRLLCLPPAGGAAHLYRRWPGLLPADIGVVAVELPGHGSRMGEPPCTDLAELVGGELLAQAEQLLDRPLVVFGHSMGAVVGFELCRALRRRRDWRPTGFVAAGCEAPSLLHTRDYAGRMTDAGVIRFLRDAGGTPASILDNPEFLDMLRPVVRADLGMLRDRVHEPDPALDCPVRVYLGALDATIDPAKARVWQQESSGDYAEQVFPGGHFFTQEAEAIVVARLRHDVRRLTGTAAAA
jgi:surfactin synthase thioesterase subunit